MGFLARLPEGDYIDYGGLISILRVLRFCDFPIRSENPLVAEIADDLRNLSYSEEKKVKPSIEISELKLKTPEDVINCIKERLDIRQVGMGSWDVSEIVGVRSDGKYQSLELQKNSYSIHSIILRKKNYYVTAIREGKKWKLNMLGTEIILPKFSKILNLCTQLEVKPYMTFYKRNLTEIEPLADSFFDRLEYILSMKSQKKSTCETKECQTTIEGNDTNVGSKQVKVSTEDESTRSLGNYKIRKRSNLRSRCKQTTNLAVHSYTASESFPEEINTILGSEQIRKDINEMFTRNPVSIEATNKMIESREILDKAMCANEMHQKRLGASAIHDKTLEPRKKFAKNKMLSEKSKSTDKLLAPPIPKRMNQLNCHAGNNSFWRCDVCHHQNRDKSQRVCEECKCKNINSLSTAFIFPDRNLNIPEIDLRNSLSVAYHEVDEKEWVCSSCHHFNQGFYYVCDRCGKSDKSQFEEISLGNIQ